MEEENFKVLIEVLKIIENAELKGSKIDDVIISMIGNFYPDMTDEQKQKLKEEFSLYIKKRDEWI